MESQEKLIALIVAFLSEIGIEVRLEPLTENTILPGINVYHGTLVIDETKLKYPGDLLHEAGHIAVVPSDRRIRLHRNVGQRAHEEMLAIAWSYAAAVHLGLAADVVFHPEGYRGGSQSLIENFTSGHYFGVSTLAWLGMTNEPGRSKSTGSTYPRMRKWLLD